MGAIALAACSEATPDAQPSAPTAARRLAPEKAVSGTGVVGAIDAAGGRVTLDHDAIAAIGWPAMTMTFKAAPAVLAGVATGDRVDFDMTLADGAATITALRKSSS